MAYYPSEQHGELINTHLSSIQPLIPPALVLPSHWGPEVSFLAASPQDTIWAATGPDPTCHSLFAETPVSEHLSHHLGPDSFLNCCPSSGFFCQGFWCADPLTYPVNCGSSEQAISETNLLPSAQSDFHQPPAPLNLPLDACPQGWRHDLSFLQLDVEWIIRRRLEGMSWEVIEQGYKQHWKDVGATRLCNKVQRARATYCIINHILPSRQQHSRQAPSRLCKCPMGCWYYV
jgi:hypothetical protein